MLLYFTDGVTICVYLQYSGREDISSSASSINTMTDIGEQLISAAEQGDLPEVQRLLSLSQADINYIGQVTRHIP